MGVDDNHLLKNLTVKWHLVQEVTWVYILNL